MLKDNGKLIAAQNCPRAHFPFPTQGRWSALGGQQLPVDDALRLELTETADNDYASQDCWSLGSIEVPPLSSSAANDERDAPEKHREILLQAFRDADTFLSLHVPPNWDHSAEKPFRSTRAGVLWHQEQVRASGSSSEDSRDLWGRTLPVQKLGKTEPTSEGAVFVSQLNTSKLVASRKDDTETRGISAELPRAFVIGTGTTVMDSSVKGDVDAVFSGKVSISTVQTWPYSHPFSLLDTVMVESLREGTRGIPRWILHDQL